MLIFSTETVGTRWLRRNLIAIVFHLLQEAKDNCPCISWQYHQQLHRKVQFYTHTYKQIKSLHISETGKIIIPGLKFIKCLSGNKLIENKHFIIGWIHDEFLRSLYSVIRTKKEKNHIAVRWSHDISFI